MNKSLNSFRAIAFFVVFLFHINLLDCGYLGVQAFFVLSGFLITPILIDMKSKMNFKLYWKNFMGRRLLRIFPIYYLMLFTLFLIGTVWGFSKISMADSFNNQLPYALTYTYNFLNAIDSFQRNTLIAHLWSLAVEEQFYIVWPFFIFFVANSKLKKWLFFIILLGPVFRFITALAISSGCFSSYISSTNIALPVYVLPFSYFDAFAIGGYFSVYFNKPVKIRWIALFSTIIVLLGFATENNSFSLLNISALGYPPVSSSFYKYIWAYSLFNIVFSLILYKMKNHEFFPKFFENNTLNYFGKISYGLYLYHFPVIAFTSDILFKSNFSIFAKIVSLLITIVISMFSYHFIELKILSFKDKLFPR